METRVIDISGRFLSGLDKSRAVTKWAIENKDTLERHLEGYDELVARLNGIPNDSSLLEHMPKTRKLKGVLGATLLPTLNEMSQGNFGHALMEARNPMLHGQRIKRGEMTEPTPSDKAYAIGTPSMETNSEALAVGTAGDLAERTFFQWARKRDLTPDGGWKKDDWLQALGEGLMLLLTEGKTPHLTHFFIKSNKDGGLGWLNEQKVEDFRRKVLPEKKLFDGSVRGLRKEDIESLRPILATWIKDRETGQLLSNELEEDLRLMSESVDAKNDRAYLVAEDLDGEVIGVMGFKRPDETMLTFTKTSSPAELTTAYVKSDERKGKGVGRALVAKLEEVAKQSGHTEIVLNSGPRYKDTGWGFYDKLPGYSRIGVAVGYYGEGGDAPVWRKEI